MTIRAPLLAVAVIAAFSAPQAVANDSYEYPYVGISGGVAELDGYCSGVATSCDDDGTFYRIFSGARLLPNFGSEVGYTHTRRFGGVDNLRIRPQALDIVGNLYLPLGQNLDLYAKAGAFVWRADITDSQGNSDSETGVDFKTGVGARIGLGETLSLRADFDIVPDFGNSTTGETDLIFFSVGAQLGF